MHQGLESSLIIVRNMLLEGVKRYPIYHVIKYLLSGTRTLCDSLCRRLGHRVSAEGANCSWSMRVSGKRAAAPDVRWF